MTHSDPFALSVARLILQQGVPTSLLVLDSNVYWDTPMYLAARKNYRVLVVLLLEVSGAASEN